MIGNVEVGPEEKALRELKHAAARYASRLLVSFSADDEVSFLEAAAIAYAKTRGPQKRARSR